MQVSGCEKGIYRFVLCSVVVTKRVYTYNYIENESSCVKHLMQVVFSQCNWDHIRHWS